MAFNKRISAKISTDTKSRFVPGDYVFGGDPDNASDSLKEFGTEWTEFIAVPVNTQTGTAYTPTLEDAGGVVEMNNSSANTVTIPTNAAVAFPIGTTIGVTMLGSGATTVTGDTGVTVNGVSAGSGEIGAQFDGVSIYKRDTDAWVMQGAHGGVS